MQSVPTEEWVFVVERTGSICDSYQFRDLCSEVLSPGAVGVMEELHEEILNIYGLDELLETRLPRQEWDGHAQVLEDRLRRVIRLLPAGVSPMPNEVFTAVEFLIYEVENRPVHVGEALVRLELLADEIRARPLLHSLVTGRAN